MKTKTKPKSLGQIAYEAYAKSIELTPHWECNAHKKNFNAIAAAVAREVKRRHHYYIIGVKK